MRLLVAPDKFAGSLTALEAAQAVADGWLRSAPGTVVDLAPLSDGGPGFVDVVRSALGGETLPAVVTGPWGEPVPAEVLVVREQRDGAPVTAYVEAAQACGLHLVPRERRDAASTTTVGVGELVGAAIDAGATRVLLGLGGSATNDGGAGMLAALGATTTAGVDALRAGGGRLAHVTDVDLAAARRRLDGIDLVAASDVDNPLLGETGASAVFGPQKGADDATVAQLDDALRAWSSLTDPTGSLASGAGAGAAGGLGFGVALLGGRRVPGIRTVLDLVGLEERAALADVVITGEGSFDWQSLRGKVVSGVAEAASTSGRPCLVLAGRVDVGRREAAAMGAAATYSLVDQAGSVEGAMAEAARHLRDLAERVAGEWARG